MAKKAVRRKPVAVVSEPESEVALDAELGPPSSVEAEPEEWKMPKPVRGQAVIFYANCMISERNADVGLATTVGDKSISVSYRNLGLSDCYHIDDPRLVDNPDIRNHIDGVWEFTKEKLEIDERFRDLEQRIKNLEG